VGDRKLFGQSVDVVEVSVRPAGQVEKEGRNPKKKKESVSSGAWKEAMKTSDILVLVLLIELLGVEGLVVEALVGELALGLVGGDRIDLSDGLSGEVGVRALASGHLAGGDDDTLLL
jgi:hypothetical protein